MRFLATLGMTSLGVGYRKIFVPSTRDENLPPSKCFIVIPNARLNDEVGQGAKRNEESSVSIKEIFLLI